jgi:hypothetical protein
MLNDIKNKIIAVIGVSNKPEKFGYKIFKDLLAAGFKVYGVHVLEKEVLGQKIFKSIKEISPVPDIVITVVMPQVTEKIVEECRVIGVKEIWMQPGSESQTAIEKAQSYGITVTHHACFMVEKGIW